MGRKRPARRAAQRAFADPHEAQPRTAAREARQAARPHPERRAHRLPDVRPGQAGTAARSSRTDADGGDAPAGQDAHGGAALDARRRPSGAGERLGAALQRAVPGQPDQQPGRRGDGRAERGGAGLCRQRLRPRGPECGNRRRRHPRAAQQRQRAQTDPLRRDARRRHGASDDAFPRRADLLQGFHAAELQPHVRRRGSRRPGGRAFAQRPVGADARQIRPGEFSVAGAGAGFPHDRPQRRPLRAVADSGRRGDHAVGPHGRLYADGGQTRRAGDDPPAALRRVVGRDRCGRRHSPLAGCAVADVRGDQPRHAPPRRRASGSISPRRRRSAGRPGRATATATHGPSGRRPTTPWASGSGTVRAKGGR